MLIAFLPNTFWRLPCLPNTLEKQISTDDVQFDTKIPQITLNDTMEHALPMPEALDFIIMTTPPSANRSPEQESMYWYLTLCHIPIKCCQILRAKGFLHSK
jgi:hypothetical protein